VGGQRRMGRDRGRPCDLEDARARQLRSGGKNRHRTSANTAPEEQPFCRHGRPGSSRLLPPRPRSRRSASPSTRRSAARRANRSDRVSGPTSFHHRSRTVTLVAVARLRSCLCRSPPIRRGGAPHIIHLLELPAGVPLRKHFVAAAALTMTLHGRQKVGSADECCQTADRLASDSSIRPPQNRLCHQSRNPGSSRSRSSRAISCAE
jgi:hypothetical protein